MLRHRARTGDLVRVRRGVYAPRGLAADAVTAINATMLRVDGCVASHQTAAALWGLPVLGRDDGQVHVSRPRRAQGARHRFPGVIVHHAALPDRHVAVRDGVAVTTVDRTVVDLARSSRFRAGVATADAALRAAQCSRAGLGVVLADCAGWPGIKRARAVVAFADPAAASPLESISRVAFDEFGVPPPRLQAELVTLDIADFYWPAQRVVGEADGLGKYASPAVLRAEKLREERLAQAGYTVVRWTWDEVFRRPDAVAWRVLQVLRRRGGQTTGDHGG